MRALQLAPSSATSYHSSSTSGVPQYCDMYDVQLFLGGMATINNLRIDPIPVMANSFINQPFDGLLGRDVLNRISLNWNGPARTLQLEYP